MMPLTISFGQGTLVAISAAIGLLSVALVGRRGERAAGDGGLERARRVG